MPQQNTAFRNAIVAALGGFLFGFDTAVISGVESSIQHLWSLDKVAHGFTVASALIGTVIGSLIAGKPAEKFGRKKVLQAIGLLYLVTSLGSALTNSWELFIAFRFLGGIGVGASSVVGPMYISEISPAAKRGRLVALSSSTLSAEFSSHSCRIIYCSGYPTKHGDGCSGYRPFLQQSFLSWCSLCMKVHAGW